MLVRLVRNTTRWPSTVNLCVPRVYVRVSFNSICNFCTVRTYRSYENASCFLHSQHKHRSVSFIFSFSYYCLLFFYMVAYNSLEKIKKKKKNNSSPLGNLCENKGRTSFSFPLDFYYYFSCLLKCYVKLSFSRTSKQ